MTSSGQAVTAEASFAQGRIYFLSGLGGGANGQHIARAINLEGDLDVADLERAVQACARRHESLRTCVTVVAGDLRLIITGKVPRLCRLDLRGVWARLTQARRDALLADLIEREAAEPFNLKRAPLMRVRLVQLTDNHSVLLLTLHHIIADAWSLTILLHELCEQFNALRAGRHDDLPVPALQYADYAAWQRRTHSAGAGMDRHLDYWRHQLADIRSVGLPTDRARRPQLSRPATTRRFPLDHALIEQLRRLAGQERVSLFMVLLAGFAVLLHRCTGRDDVVIGGTSSGRERPEVRDIIGFFVNMLVYRTTIRPESTLRDVVLAVAETCHDAYEHREISFEQLVAARGGTREPDRHPLFQVVFQMIDDTAHELSFTGLTARMREVDTGQTPFDLVLTVVDAGHTFDGSVQYAADLFDDDSIDALVVSWQRVLGQLAQDPEVTVSAFGLAPEKPAAPRHDLAGSAGTVAILDRYGHPVPAGIPGEIHVDRDGGVRPTGRIGRQRADGRVTEVCGDTAHETATGAGAPDGAAPVLSATEARLATIWREVLCRDEVGRDDNFFLLGGHSLLAMMLATSIQERLGQELTLDEIFRHPTLAEMAAALPGESSLP